MSTLANSGDIDNSAFNDIINKTFECKFVYIFLSTNFNICFGCSKELPH